MCSSSCTVVGYPNPVKDRAKGVVRQISRILHLAAGTRPSMNGYLSGNWRTDLARQNVGWLIFCHKIILIKDL